VGMGNRKATSKGVRFEVFKRDAFTCQHCGQKDPDVLLQVDHIEPVSKGGSNDMLSLTTSCRDCTRSGEPGAREALLHPRHPQE
jgi:5-methylcytosine-specific restriction endonuclease McrA